MKRNEHPATIEQALCPHCWQTVAVQSNQIYEAHDKPRRTETEVARCPLSEQPLRPLFFPGQQVMTIGAIEVLLQAQQTPTVLLHRHQHGDWGQVPAEDAVANVQAVCHGLRILSSYPLSTGQTIWIISEADRSVTTLLTPGEY